jgi:type II secretory pathway pseudopilin PulG
MKHGAWSVEREGPGTGGFSLVEVTVAIGIFAFVAVGILGLLPAALKQRADSSRDTRAVLIAEELFAAVQAATSLSNVIMRDGPALSARNNEPENLLQGPVVLGYPSQTSVPYGLFSRRRGFNPDSVWQNSQLPAWAAGNDIDTLARLSAVLYTNTGITNGLYQITVQVRSPANVPLSRSQPVTFTSLFYSP